jgi:rRNA maturation RNase YbeY
MNQIHFFSDAIPFQLKYRTLIRSWLLKCASAERKKVEALNYIFCSDKYLRKINRQYLNHNYFTDIITFSASESDHKIISGDIYISIERVRYNAKYYGAKVNEELHRVMVHGLLHLCGYNDQTENEKKIMRHKEELYLKKI